MNKCPICGANCEKEYCWKHKNNKFKSKENLEYYINKRNKFFLNIWKTRPHICIVTKIKLGKEPNNMYFHHVLAKNKYPEAEFDEENIVILHPNTHANVETDMYRYDEINKIREKLKTKYNL